MADFQQNVVPTFTRLADEDLERMKKSTIKHSYLAPATRCIRSYKAFAGMNSLPKFDRHVELGSVVLFAAALDPATAALA